MEEIHKSFSKLDMIEIIDVFKIPLDYFDVSKTNLSKQLVKYINDTEIFSPSIEFFINDKKTLVEYLSKPNQIKVAQFQRKEIMYIAKNVLLYSKNKSFTNTCFKTEYELDTQVKYISMFGDIPTVRRAITELNKIIDTTYDIDISPKIKFEIARKEKLKKCNSIIEFKYGKFTLFLK
tara:strand:- start:1566 stop:2099 length:534 start_codon:yes stop_codon:yes gene_type:complete